jgi:citrate lyase subunit beta/citryl-CoA lyase
MRLLRSMLFSPGNNMRMLYRAGLLGADAVILDLEDAVPMTDKETARLFVRDTIPQLVQQRSQVFVRVNALTTGLTAEDLQWVLQPGLAGVVLPKTESKGDIAELAHMLDDWMEARDLEWGEIAIIPILETAKGVLNAQEIAAADPRVVALAFGGVDFSRDMGVTLTREGTELLFARSYVALAARAAGRLAIDTPWIDVSDQAGLVAQAQAGRQIGFRGKLLIHPSQVAPVNQVFSPTPEEMTYARQVVDAFRDAEQKGIGAISLDGKMIDVANYRQAQDLLALTAAMG